MLQALSTPHNCAVTLVLLAVCCMSAIAASVVGVADNLAGAILAFVGAAAFILALAHPWRAAASFRGLFYASFLALVGLVILDGLIEIYLGKWLLVHASSGVRNTLEQVWAALFVLILVLVPAGFIIGLGGWITISIRNRRPPRDAHGAG